jgi:hypothetical protein
MRQLIFALCCSRPDQLAGPLIMHLFAPRSTLTQAELAQPSEGLTSTSALSTP